MRLLDVTVFHAPRSGGIRRYLEAKAAFLQRQPGVAHCRLVPGRRDTRGRDVWTVAEPIVLGSAGYRLPLRLPSWRRAVREFAPDLIELGDPWHVSWAVAGMASRLGSAVVGFHHSDAVRLVRDRLGAPFDGATRRWLRRLYARCDLVFAPSRHLADELRALGVAHVVHQPLGVDLDVFHPARRDPRLRRRLGIAGDDVLMVYAGRFAMEKHLDVLAECARRLGRGFHLLLVGNGRLPPLPGNATVLPFCASRRRLASILAGADVFVHGGDRETFGLVALEAMACGTPVVVPQDGALCELLPRDGDSVGIAVPARDAAACAEAVRALAQQPRERLRTAARAHAECGYAWSHVLGLAFAHYCRLLGTSATPVPSRDAALAVRDAPG